MTQDELQKEIDRIDATRHRMYAMAAEAEKPIRIWPVVAIAITGTIACLSAGALLFYCLRTVSGG